MRQQGRRARKGAFGPFPSALVVVGCVRSIPVRPGGRRFRTGAFGPFPSALGVVVFVRLPFASAVWVVVLIRVRSVHSLAPLGSSGSFGCVRSIPECPGSRRIRLGAFGPFPCALGVCGFVRVHSVHSRQLWKSSDSFGCVWSIRASALVVVVLVWVQPLFHRVVCGAFGPFWCAHGVVVLVRVHSRASWGSFGYVRSIPVCHSRGGSYSLFVRVRSVHSRVP